MVCHLQCLDGFAPAHVSQLHDQASFAHYPIQIQSQLLDVEMQPESQSPRLLQIQIATNFHCSCSPEVCARDMPFPESFRRRAGIHEVANHVQSLQTSLHRPCREAFAIRWRSSEVRPSQPWQEQRRSIVRCAIQVRVSHHPRPRAEEWIE